jgi:hypothetical protein
MKRVLSLLALVACTGGTQVRVERAAELVTTSGMHVSVFGVFHDGRMSEPAWSTLSPKVSAALGRTFCETGYTQDLREANPELLASIDRDVRENGIDDTVLNRVTPNAQGELIMVLMSYRYIPGHRAQPAAPPVQGRSPSMGGRMARGGFTRTGGAPPADEDHVFELSASFFSTTLKKLVAQIDLRYEGDDLDEAMDAFTKKLGLLLPGAKCVGWHWEASHPPTTGEPPPVQPAQ